MSVLAQARADFYLLRKFKILRLGHVQVNLPATLGLANFAL